ncbi:MAG: FtsQ-type POTRA domain-containing protein [Candidatus Moranbacteria bacterium]|nr:FtsQ-type POTRA domain-containing protein [Candidatus Moranbacteria bacterium]MBP6034271.1 FtsQ-type POTRA domain-containing protein [Candidatus Moranbacteria bacterium]MBP7695903.1 FtsQ-type POTRA domain-containing protein [Candidatus Moranbacteria bacterium]
MKKLFHLRPKTPDRLALFQKKTERKFIRGGHGEKQAADLSDTWNMRSIGLMALWLLFVGAVGYQLFFSGALSVSRIEIDGANLLTQGEIEQLLHETMMGKHAGIVDRDNLLFLSERALAERIEMVSPLVRSIEIRKVFPGTLRVSLLERGHLTFWCSGDRCFLIDEAGVISEPAEHFGEDRVQHLFLRDESSKPASPGDQVADPAFLDFVRGLPQALAEQSDIRMTDTVYLPSKYADELRIESENGLVLLLSSSVPLEKTLNTLRIVREKAVSAEQSEKLVSVDLRVPSKAFYRLPDEPVTEVSAPESAMKSQSEE